MAKKEKSSTTALNVQGGSVGAFQAEKTGQQAMMFQPFNGSLVAGIVGGGTATGMGGVGEDVRHQNPGLWSAMHVNGLPISWPAAYPFFRRILSDPSVRLVRAIAYAPVMAATWSWEATPAAPGEAMEVLREMFDPIRAQYLDDAVRSDDFGFAGFEKMYKMHKGMLTFVGAKPLLPELTGIHITPGGAFNGFCNNGNDIDLDKALLVNFDAESGNLYGRGRVRSLLDVMPWWYDANEGAAQYDRKIAGVFLVCHYPPGSSIDATGKEVENAVIAQELLNHVAAGRPIAVCNEFAGEAMAGMDFLNNYTGTDRTRWRIEILEDRGSRQPGFTERLTYLDKLKARGFLVPERAAFEAQKSGSRADSESMGDIVVVMGQLRADYFAAALNGLPSDPTSAINTVLRINWGPEAMGTVRCKPAVIEDDKKKFIRDITKGLLLASPKLAQVGSSVREIFESAGLPIPSDPVDDEEVMVVLDDLAAVSIKDPGGGTIAPSDSNKSKDTLARIHKAMGRADAVRLSTLKRLYDARGE